MVRTYHSKKLHQDCCAETLRESQMSKMIIRSKDQLELPGKIVIESTTTIFTTFTPKIRAADFFILLFD